MSTLFDIVNDMQCLYEMATDPECDPQALQDTIEGVLGMIQAKAGGYVNVIQQLEMEQKQAEIVSKAFAEKARLRKENIKRMKDALMYAMDQLDKKDLDAGDYTIKIQKNGGQEPLVIDNADKVPDSLTKITVEPDKDKIREYLKDNTADFAHLEKRGRHITIK